MLATQSAESGFRPRLPRVEVDKLATLRCGARIFWVTTRDISQGGVKIATDREFARGDQVVLALDGLPPISGVIRWSREGQAGIGFNEVIPFRTLMGWLRAQQPEKIGA